MKAVRTGERFITISKRDNVLLSGNAAGLLTVVHEATVASRALRPVLLFINLLTDSLPAIAIGMEENDDDLMGRLPRNVKESLLSPQVMKIIMFEGF